MGAQSFTCSVPISVRLTCPNNFTSWAHRPSDLPESTKAAPRIVPAWPRAPRSQFSSLGEHGRFSNVCRACLSESCSSGRAPPWPLALLQGARLLSQARLPERGASYALCEHGNVVRQALSCPMNFLGSVSCGRDNSAAPGAVTPHQGVQPSATTRKS